MIADFVQCPFTPKIELFQSRKKIAHDILLTVEKLIITLAVNRLLCYEQLCAFSCNSLDYRQCYKGTPI